MEITQKDKDRMQEKANALIKQVKTKDPLVYILIHQAILSGYEAAKREYFEVKS